MNLEFKPAKIVRHAVSASAALLLALVAGCAKNSSRDAVAAGPAENVPVAKHEHHPPHGGTPVVLGAEAAHVELVVDATAGRIQAYVLDGELENFIRVAAPKLEIVARLADGPRTLELSPVANSATGETVGDTSLFQAEAEWLRTTPRFEAKLVAITVRGVDYRDVAFAFPEGNDHD